MIWILKIGDEFFKEVNRHIYDRIVYYILFTVVIVVVVVAVVVVMVVVVTVMIVVHNIELNTRQEKNAIP